MTREQTRASLAWDHVSGLKTEVEAPIEKAPSPEEKKKAEDRAKRLLTRYGTLAGKLPALLRSAGLCQALHFLRSRKKDAKAGESDMSERLLRHLAEQLNAVSPGIGTDADELCRRARRSELPAYLWLSREAVACATWYARLAKSELGVELTDDAPPDDADETAPEPEVAP